MGDLEWNMIVKKNAAKEKEESEIKKENILQNKEKLRLELEE